MVNPLNGFEEQSVVINNNPTINYAELVLQPQTLAYGLYRFIYTVTMTNNNFTSQIDTYIQVIPSGLVISAPANQCMAAPFKYREELISQYNLIHS